MMDSVAGIIMAPPMPMLARDLAKLSDGEVWVLHLRERETGVGKVSMMDETVADANAVVMAALEVLTTAGVKARGEVRNTTYGYAAREITGDAKDHDADIIVMGSRGHGDLTGLVLGSTAHKVIQLADRPVLIIR
jgi:nucleotide-binding universal stress UspA family protein